MWGVTYLASGPPREESAQLLRPKTRWCFIASHQRMQTHTRHKILPRRQQGQPVKGGWLPTVLSKEERVRGVCESHRLGDRIQLVGGTCPPMYQPLTMCQGLG